MKLGKLLDILSQYQSHLDVDIAKEGNRLFISNPNKIVVKILCFDDEELKDSSSFYQKDLDTKKMENEIITLMQKFFGKA